MESHLLVPLRIWNPLINMLTLSDSKNGIVSGLSPSEPRSQQIESRLNHLVAIGRWSELTSARNHWSHVMLIRYELEMEIELSDSTDLISIMDNLANAIERARQNGAITDSDDTETEIGRIWLSLSEESVISHTDDCATHDCPYDPRPCDCGALSEESIT